MTHKTANIKNLILCALFTVLIVICTYIQIPFAIPFTMQTFAIALACLVLGSNKALVCVITYILLGLIGFPVFSGIGSTGVLLGPTGGFIFGFLLMVICYMILSKTFSSFCKKHIITSLFISLIPCYIFGAVWYTNFAYSQKNTDFLTVLKICVLPFIIPDIIKLFIANKVSKSLSFYLSKFSFDKI